MEGDGAQSSHNPIKCVGLGWAATQLSLVGLVWALTEPTSYFFNFFVILSPGFFFLDKFRTI